MKRVCVIGGSVIDLFLYPHHDMNLYDSNPGYMKSSPGGVGRNIAENLSRLGIHTTLITPLGEDHYRKMIEDQAKDSGLNLCPINIKETPLYVSIINQKGEDLVGVAIMDGIESIHMSSIMKFKDVVESSDIVVLDTNLSEDVLTEILVLYGEKSYIDAISGEKAKKLKHLLSHIHTLKMNFTEAKTLTGFGEDSVEGLEQLGKYFLDQGTKEVIITLGEKGVYYENHNMAQFRSSLKIDVVNSTGAGDAFFAGVIFAKVNELDPISYGIANACINLCDEHAVSQVLSKDIIIQYVKE
jgi:pseudouridine kinase